MCHDSVATLTTHEMKSHNEGHTYSVCVCNHHDQLTLTLTYIQRLCVQPSWSCWSLTTDSVAVTHANLPPWQLVVGSSTVLTTRPVLHTVTHTHTQLLWSCEDVENTVLLVNCFDYLNVLIYDLGPQTSVATRFLACFAHMEKMQKISQVWAVVSTQLADSRVMRCLCQFSSDLCMLFITVFTHIQIQGPALITWRHFQPSAQNLQSI